MTNGEATILVNREIYVTKAELNNLRTSIGLVTLACSIAGTLGGELVQLLGADNITPLLAGAGGGVGFGVVLCRGKIEDYRDARAWLKTLKDLRNQLENGTNVFEQVEVEDFKEKLKQFK